MNQLNHIPYTVDFDAIWNARYIEQDARNVQNLINNLPRGYQDEKTNNIPPQLPPKRKKVK